MEMKTNDSTCHVKKKKKGVKTIQESSLPSNIISDILSRLRVRSIIRFKIVCKSWYALLSDPMFVEKHLKASMEDKDNANHALIIISNFGKDLNSCSIPSILHEEYSTAHPLHYPRRFTDPAHEVRIVGSVHGLFLIDVVKVGLFLWNPATRELSKELPPSGFVKCSDFMHTVYGFGYDQSSSDYKVVAIETYLGSDIGVKIFGLKTNSWSKIENFPDCVVMGDSGKFVSGALHWPASFGTGLNHNLGILAFNMSEETFSEISPPCFGEIGFLFSVIGVLDGCLCLLYKSGDTIVDVWMMKEYDEIESWSKMFSVSFQNVLHGFQYSAPLFISKTNEVLLLKIGVWNLVLYNAEDNTVNFRGIQNICNIYKVYTYIETLVAPCHQATIDHETLVLPLSSSSNRSEE